MSTFNRLFSGPSGENEAALKLIVAAIEPLLVRERLFREDFERRLLAEFREHVEARMNHYHLRAPIAFDPRATLMIHTIDGQRLILDQHESFMAHHLIEHGEWESQVRALIRKLLPNGGVFLDVGANIGAHSLLAASVVGPTGRVHALEPHPRVRGILEQNVEINGLVGVIDVLGDAIGEAPQEAVPFEYFPEHPAMSGFKVPQKRIEELRGRPQVIDVRVTTIDDVLARFGRKADLIKIDVEGFELAALRGALQTMATADAPAFIVEYGGELMEAVVGRDAPDAMHDIIVGAGYVAYPVTEPFAAKPLDWGERRSFNGDLVLCKPNSPAAGRLGLTGK